MKPSVEIEYTPEGPPVSKQLPTSKITQNTSTRDVEKHLLVARGRNRKRHRVTDCRITVVGGRRTGSRTPRWRGSDGKEYPDNTPNLLN